MCPQNYTSSKQVEMVYLLLEAGADTNIIHTVKSYMKLAFLRN